jgi:anti-anti-sigma factor
MDVACRRDADGGVEITVARELDLDTAPQLDHVLRRVVTDSHTRSVIVDLTETTFCDSSGLALFDEWYSAAAGRGIPLRLANVRPQVARVLEIVGLLDVLTRP